MTMSDLAAVPFDGAYRLRRADVMRRADTEVQAPTDEEVRRPPEAKRKRVNDGSQDSVKHAARMLALRRTSE